jgi:RHS repeat-associated protein
MAGSSRYRFSTKYFDFETELYYYGYRFYSPGLHRWLNRDPIEENGGLNLYGFCKNDPVNYMDPKGDDFIYIIDSKAVKGQGHAAVITGPVNGKWRYDSFGKPTKNHRHGQYVFKSKKEALAFAIKKQYTHYARWCTDETQDSIAQNQADLWHTGSGSNYKTLREYDIDGDNCQALVNDMADAAGIETYNPRLGLHAPNFTYKRTKDGANDYGELQIP